MCFGSVPVTAASTLLTRAASPQTCSLWAAFARKLRTVCFALLCVSFVHPKMHCLCLVGPFAVCLRVRGLSVRVFCV